MCEQQHPWANNTATKQPLVHMDYAHACFNLAQLVGQQAQQSVMMNSPQKLLSIERGANLALTASAIAEASGENGVAEEFVGAMLALLLEGRSNKLVEHAAAVTRLKTRFSKITGEDWDSLADVEDNAPESDGDSC